MQVGSLTHGRKGGGGTSWCSLPSEKPNSQCASGWSHHWPHAPLLHPHQPVRAQRSRGGFSRNTVQHNADGQSPLPWRTLPGICNSVLVTQPACQPPSPASVLPTDTIDILWPGSPLALLLSLQASAALSPSLAGPSPLPQDKENVRATAVGHHRGGGQGRERGWRQDIHSSTLSPAKELAHFRALIYFPCFCTLWPAGAAALFWVGVGATCQRAALWWRCVALSGFVSFFNAEQHSLRLKAYQCFV